MLRLLILALTFMPAPTLPAFAAVSSDQHEVSSAAETPPPSEQAPSNDEETGTSKIPQIQEEIIADHGPAYPSLFVFEAQSIFAIPLATLLPVKIGGLFRPPKRA